MTHDELRVATGSSGQLRVWLWFAAWLVVGVGYAVSVVGALTIGPFILPIPVLGTVALVMYRPARVGAPGLISGLSLPLFFVAFLNRDGPGTVCTTTPTGGGCQDEWSPWPFVGVGIALLAAGAVIMWTSVLHPNSLTHRVTGRK